MNADLKRVRGDDTPSSSSSPAKRRALSVSGSAPSASGSNDGGVEEWQAVVEVKRKEAIYRQMLEYRRMHSREVQRANELEAQKRVLEASVQAVEVCWSQLVSAIRDLAGQNADLPAPSEDSEPILDPQLSRPELDAALSKRLPSTRKLISSFVDLSAKNGTTPAVQDLHTKCSRLQAESSSLKTRNRDLQAQLTSLKDEKDTTTRDLLKAQKALDRQRMEFDKAQEEWRSRDRDKDKDEKDDKRNEGERGSATPNPNGAGSGHATPNGKVENDEKPFDTNAHAGMLLDTTELEEKAASRLKQLEALHQEHTVLQQQYDQLKIASTNPSEQTLRDSPFFQVYLHQLSTYYNRAQELQQRFDASEKKLDELRTNNFEFKELITQEAKAETEQLRAQITQKNTDLSRLRASRDEKEAELLERRARETEKTRFAEEVEELAKVRAERIIWLESEVKRLKGKLGAESGSRGYLTFLRAEGGLDGDYVKDLESRLVDAETKLASLLTESKDGENEAAKADLEVARAKLDKFEKLFGPDPDTASDAQKLANQLQQAEAERESLKLQVQEAEEATNALYAEIEGLSNLCDNTTKTMSQKTYELKDAELKMNRLATEKAKANNKYFAAMQSKDVLDQENKSIQRTVEKQSQWLQKAQEVERGLNAQIAAHEKGLIALKNTSLDLQKQLAQITSEKSQLELRLSQAQATLAEAQKTMHQRVADYAAEKAARTKLEEEVEDKQRKMEKMKERHDAMVGASAGKNGVSASEYELQRERDKLWKLMRCSCCNNNFKQQVITRCMHTFCKKCLDDRVQSRSRKCPACGVAFSTGEVQTIYWQ